MQFDTTILKENFNSGIKRFTLFLCLIGAATCCSHKALSQDSDNDGVADAVDSDDDNDGILDTAECSLFTEAPFTFAADGSLETLAPIASNNAFNSDISNSGASGWTNGVGSMDSWVSPMPTTGSGAFTGMADGMPASPDGGVFAAALVSNSFAGESFQTTITGLTIGQIYILKFYQANAGIEGSTPVSTSQTARWQVDFGSESFFSTGMDYKGESSQVWIEETMVFTATATSQTLTFLADADGNTIDYEYMAVDGIRLFTASSCLTDTDSDGIPDSLDLDSDGDGCADAIEGGGTLVNNQLVTSAMPGGSSGVQDNLGTTIDANGIPTVAAGGQSVGLSKDNTDSALCTDSDNDGINDYVDLDDDNDGILDTDECTTVTETWGTSPWVWTTGVDNATIVDASGVTFTLDVATMAAGNLDVFGGTQLDAASGGFAGGIDDILVAFDPDSGEGLSPVTITATFSQPVRDLSFLITDIEAFSKIDRVTITSNTGIIPTLSTVTAGVPTFSISGNSASGTVAHSSNDDRGTALVSFSGFVQTVTILYEDALAPANPIGRAVGLFGDLSFCISADTDADTIPDSLDLDSDGDGCADAIEGGNTLVNNQLITSAMPGGSTGVQANLGTTIDADGVPTVAAGGQSVGLSKDNADSALCTDSDNDGINDYVDLDDDNDGILDTDECTEYIESPFAFAADGSLETLAPVASNNAFNSNISNGGASGWTNVVGSMDSWVSPMPTTGSGAFSGMADGMPSSSDGGVFVAALVSNSFAGESFQTTVTDLTIGEVYILKFYQANAGIEGSTPVSTSETARWQVDFGAESFFSTGMDYKGESSQVWIEETMTFTATATSQTLTFLADADGNTIDYEYMALDGIRLFSRDACTTDTDGDGIIDGLDLDSDGDGCADAIEGGDTLVNNQLVTSAMPGGSTGVQDNLGTTVDANGIPTVAAGGQSVGLSKDNTDSSMCTDTDNDGINDYVDIDDDNDGVLDTDEGFCTSTSVPGANASSAAQEVATVTNPANTVDGVNGTNGTATGAASMNAASQMLVTLRGGSTVAAGTVISIVVQRTSVNAAFLVVTESTDGVTFVNTQISPAFPQNSYTTFNYTLTTEATTLRLRNAGISGVLTIDNVSYPTFGTTCNIPDSDEDGISDYLDLDSDNDGTADIVEARGVDTDGDGRVDSATDTDNDGFADTFDTDDGGTNLTDPDSDGDGIVDRRDLDSDNDGIADIIEAGGTDADGDGKTDSTTDTNGDGFVDTYDTDDGGTNLADADSDGDGFNDRIDLDSDNDGIADIVEAGGTDADGDGKADSSTDTDGDGFADTFDTDDGGTNLAELDSDGDGVADRKDLDSDNDGIVDLIETQATTGSPITPTGTDTDNDGLDDAFDTDCAPCGGTTGVAIVPVNTDGTDEPDYKDADSDNDGLHDLVEAYDTDGNFITNTLPNGLDADGDGLDDAFDNVISTNPTTGPTNGGQTANTFPDNTTAAQTTERDWREAQSPSLLGSEPGGVTNNLLLWVKADIGGTFWQDQSGAGTTVTSAGAPTNGSLLNFNPTNGFDGSDYYNTNLSINADTYQDLAVFAVYVPTADNSGAVWGENNGGFDRYTLDDSGVGEDQAVSNGTANESGISGLFTAATPTLSSVIFDEDQVNGSSVFVDGENTLDFTADHGGETSNNFQIAALGANDRDFDGRIAELIVYDQLLATATDRQQVESYLALKYGITLSSDTDGDNTAFEAQEGDYIASDGSTVFWDASANSTHHHNVAGIARDDDSGLNQKQSRSVNSDAIVTIGLDGNVTGLPASNAENTYSFPFDKDAIVWGHDGEALTDNDENIDYDPTQVNSRLNREWKVRTNLTNPLIQRRVTVIFDVSNIPGPSGVGTNDENDIVLLLDADGDFSSGAQVVFQSGGVDGDGLVNFTVVFTDNTHFTLASAELGALPITMLSFESEKKDDHIELKWKTLDETNNSFFRIERSSNGTEFETIGYKEGAGTTTTTSSYSFKDYTPLNGRNYYRLVDIDNNGVENYSHLVSESFTFQPETILPFPNPVRSYESIYLKTPHAKKIQNLKIYTSYGTQVRVKVAIRNNLIEIRSNDFKSGVYMIHFKLNNRRYRRKVIVEN